MDFIIDTVGESELKYKDQLVNIGDDDDDDDADDDDLDIDVTKIKIRDGPEQIIKRKSKVNPNDIDIDEFEQDMGWKNGKTCDVKEDVQLLTEKVAPIGKVLKKSVIKPGFERLKRIPEYDANDKKLKASRKAGKSSTKGKGWFHLPATEMTDEIRHDLEIIQMRSVLDPKHFYKKNDMKVIPKYFHIGKVLDSPAEFYSSRLTKKERKCTIVDELMADAQFAKFNKRKYKEIIDEKRKLHYKAHKRAKKLKKKGKK